MIDDISSDGPAGPPESPDAPEPARGGLGRGRIVLIAAAVGVTGYLLLVLLTSRGIAPGTTARGVDIGGLSVAQASDRLTSAWAGSATAPLTAKAGDRSAPVSPQQAGLTLDAAATARAAAAPSFNPMVVVRRLTRGQHQAAVVRVDGTALTGAVATAATALDRPPVEGTVVFTDGRPTAVQPANGVTVVRDDAATVLTRQFGAGATEVAFPVRQAAATVSPDEVERARKEFGVPAMSGPVVLTVADSAITLTPAQIGAALSMRAESGRLVPVLDGAALRRSAAASLASIEQQSRDATFRIVSGRPQVVPSVTGRAVAADDLAAAVLPALTRAEGARSASVQFTEAQPKLTTEQAAGLGVKEVVSTFTTAYPYAAYRLQNIHRAADLIDGALVLPGQTFSLNDRVGERTAANGFAEGIIISEGRFAKDFGGGVSQVATTTYNAAFFAGLKDVQHRPHSFYISRYPAGREATVAWPDLDMKFGNDTPYGVFVDTSYTNSTVTVTLWGTKIWDIEAISGPRTNPQPPGAPIYDTSPDCVPQTPVAGFDITITRVFRRGGVEVKREDTNTHYDAADPVLCQARPATPAAPTASPAPTTTPPPVSPSPAKPSPTPSPSAT